MTNPFTALREFYEQNPKSAAVKVVEDQWEALVASKDRKALMAVSNTMAEAMENWEDREQDVKESVFDEIVVQLQAAGISLERDDD